MENYRFYSNLKISKFRLSLLVINTVLAITYTAQGYFNWALYLLVVIAIFELLHVVDVVLRKSFMALEGDTLTISKWLFGKKVYDLSEYDNFKGRQRNGLINSLVAYKTDNPKLYIFIMNIYKTSLTDFYQLVAKAPGEVVETVSQDEE